MKRLHKISAILVLLLVLAQQSANAQGKAHYTLKSQQECLALVAKSSVASSITFEGESITTAGVNAVAKQFTEVEGTVTIKGTSVGALNKDGFFSTVKVGGIELYDNEQLVGVNGFNDLASLTGNFIVKNCPKACFHWPQTLASLTSVGGDFILENTFFAPATLVNLESVEGDFKIASVTNYGKPVYHFPDMKSLKKVGGNIEIKDLPYYIQLGGFEHLAEIGGTVTFGPGCADPSLSKGWVNKSPDSVKIGLDLINYWVTKGIIKEKDVTVYKFDGSVFPYGDIKNYNKAVFSLD